MKKLAVIRLEAGVLIRREREQVGLLVAAVSAGPVDECEHADALAGRQWAESVSAHCSRIRKRTQSRKVYRQTKTNGLVWQHLPRTCANMPLPAFA